MVNVSASRRLLPATATRLPVAPLDGCVAVQVALHPPQLLLLKSSHASVPTFRPSPQIGEHTVFDAGDEGVLQLKPTSRTHIELQPSLLFRLASSHWSTPCCTKPSLHL